MLQESSKSVVIIELDEISVGKWQREWDQATKGENTKEYFPIIADRINMKLNITQNLNPWSRGMVILEYIYTDLN